jgi:hypothetical protein
VAARSPTSKLGEILVAAGVIDENQLTLGLSHAHATGQRLGSALVDLGAVSSDTIARALAKQRGVAAATDAHFAGVAANPKLAEIIPVALARSGDLVPLALGADDREIIVAMADPTDLALLDRLAFTTGRRIRPASASLRRIRAAIDLLSGADLDAATAGGPRAPTRDLELAVDGPVVKRVSSAQPPKAPTVEARRPRPRGNGGAFAVLALLALVVVGGAFGWRAIAGARDRGAAVGGTTVDPRVNLTVDLPDEGWRHSKRDDLVRRKDGAILRTSVYAAGVDPDRPDVGLILAVMTPADDYPSELDDDAFFRVIRSIEAGLTDRELSELRIPEVPPPTCSLGPRPGHRGSELGACQGAGTYRGTAIQIASFTWIEAPEQAVMAVFFTALERESMDDAIGRILLTIHPTEE